MSLLFDFILAKSVSFHLDSFPVILLFSVNGSVLFQIIEAGKVNLTEEKNIRTP